MAENRSSPANRRLDANAIRVQSAVGRSDQGQVVHRAEAVPLREAVVGGVAVPAQQPEFGDRALVLGEHREALAVQRRVGREVVPAGRDHDLAYPHG